MRPALIGFVLALSACVLFAGPAAANFCTLSATAVSFGNYNIFTSTDVHANGSVTFNCTQHTAITIKFSKGSASTFNPRQMTSGINLLNYNLYLDAALTMIWGDGTGGSSFYSNSAPASGNNTLTAYGDIPALQTGSAPASYADTITATISF